MKFTTIGAGVVSATLLVGLLGVTPAMAARAPAPNPSPAPASPAVPNAHMGDYSATRFEQQAAALPDDLTGAVERDLGISPEQYLANAAATYDAGQVIDGLTKEGVTVESAQLDGTRLVLGVGSVKDAARAVERGADAVVGLKAKHDLSKVKFTKFEDLVNGTGWAYEFQDTMDQSYWWGECSVGFNGYKLSTGDRQFVTAGHCGMELPDMVTPPFKLTQKLAGGQPTQGSSIGAADQANFHFGDGLDSGLVDVTNAALAPRPSVSTWGGGKGAPTAGTKVSVRGMTQAVTGTLMCKSGMNSGWTCGKVLETDTHVDVSGYDVNTFITSACSIPGDSGGPAMAGNYALGVLSGGTSGPCSKTTESAFFPMTSPDTSIVTQHPDWELAVDLQKPLYSNPSGVAFQSAGMIGTLPGGVPGDTVYLYLDGATTPTSQVPIGSGTTWNLPLTAASIGSHTFRIVAGWGTRNLSPAATGTVIVAAAPTVDRIQSGDRYKTAVAISQAGFPSSKGGVVYIVSGQAFPDALSAAPVAASQNGPLLLTMSTTLPSIVKAELARLAPKKVVVIGGIAAISPAVETALRAAAPGAAVTRIAGSNRYATGRAIVASAFGSTGVNTLYIATGTNFPDALSAGAAAGSSGSAVLLVPGASSSLDSATLALVAKLHPKAIRIAGGLAAVSAGIEKALAGKAASVKRLAGSSRWTTSQQINSDAFTAASKIYIASGMVFPDALAGAVLAARNASPLYVSQTTCVPPGVIRAIAGYGVSQVTVLGGTSAQSPNVANLVSCSQ